MGYLILYIIIAIWVFLDARKRQNHVIVWPLASACGFGLIALPIYFAKRNLREGEVRKGGTAWNVLKNFAIFWTLTILAVAFVGLIGLGAIVQQGANEYEQAGAAIAAGITGAFGFGLIAALWFILFAGALVLGFFLRKSSIVEIGPTGPLATGPKPDARTPTTSPPVTAAIPDPRAAVVSHQDTMMRVECSSCNAEYSLKKPPPQRATANCKKCGGKIVIDPPVVALQVEAVSSTTLLTNKIIYIFGALFLVGFFAGFLISSAYSKF